MNLQNTLTAVLPFAPHLPFRAAEHLEWFGGLPGERIAIIVNGTDVNGAYCILQVVAQPGMALPLHSHAEDEVFFVTEGTVTFEVDGQLIEGGVGSTVVIPAGAPHRWAIRTGAQAQFLVFFSPGGVEQMFRRIGGLAPDQIVGLAQSFGSEVLGPPLA